MRDLLDYFNNNINLSDESWNHIQQGHPEINLDLIAKTLLHPIEVRESIQTSTTLLYYSIKIKSEIKTRYICVVVKKTFSGEFYIQTAMTTSYLKAGRVVFKEN